MKVAILDDFHDAWASTEGVRRLRERIEIEIFREPIATPGALDGFDAVIANRERTRFDRSLLESLASVRLIVQTGNHAAHIDFDAADQLGITVAQASGGYSIGAAELAIGLAIAGMRRISALDREVRAGHWSPPTTPVMHGKTFGVIGLGRVGTHAARIASAFGMNVVAWSPRLDEATAAERGAVLRPLERLLRESDVVSIHASLTAESRGLLDRDRIALMRATAWLVNTARGPIVDESALISALRNGEIGGAGLDVFDQEPLPANHPLTALPNVVLTPHIGWPTDAGYARFSDSACDTLLDFIEGREVRRFPRH